MSDWEILITDGLEENGQAILRAAARTDVRSGIEAQELLQIIPNYDALIVRGRTQVGASVFEAGKCLRVIGRTGVGVDNIDLQAAKAYGVTVVNTPMATTLAVAELTLGLMVALARDIPHADSAVKRGQWLKRELRGVELSGKILGVIGVGNIGTAVAQRAAALGMSVLGYDALQLDGEISRRGAQPVTLTDLYARSDFITLHVPLTTETRGLIGVEALRQMKPGVRIVCTARGGIIDERALLKALKAGKVVGAALDVFAQEPPGLNPLVSHPNVIATPHIGAQTAEAQARAAVDIANEVLAALRGQPLRWEIA